MWLYSQFKLLKRYPHFMAGRNLQFLKGYFEHLYNVSFTGQQSEEEGEEESEEDDDSPEDSYAIDFFLFSYQRLLKPNCRLTADLATCKSLY